MTRCTGGMAVQSSQLESAFGGESQVVRAQMGCPEFPVRECDWGVITSCVGQNGFPDFPTWSVRLGEITSCAGHNGCPESPIMGHIWRLIASSASRNDSPEPSIREPIWGLIACRCGQEWLCRVRQLKGAIGEVVPFPLAKQSEYRWEKNRIACPR
jgi:hypothetical protein